MLCLLLAARTRVLPAPRAALLAPVLLRLPLPAVVDEKQKNEIKKLLTSYDRMLLVSGASSCGACVGPSVRFPPGCRCRRLFTGAPEIAPLCLPLVAFLLWREREGCEGWTA